MEFKRYFYTLQETKEFINSIVSVVKIRNPGKFLSQGLYRQNKPKARLGNTSCKQNDVPRRHPLHP